MGIGIEEPTSANETVLAVIGHAELPGFTVEHFDRAEDLLTALAARDERWLPDASEWIFRGQRDAAWDLVPSAFREGIRVEYGRGGPFTPAALEWEQMAHEADIIRRFLEELNRQGLQLPSEASFRWSDFIQVLRDITQPGYHGDWPPEDVAPLFALAQHHGIPTRLLDWTERGYVAAYFAGATAAAALRAGVKDSGELAVWALCIAYTKALLMGALERKDQKFPQLRMVRPPRSTNPNLQAQYGTFTVLVDHTRKWGDAAGYPPVNRLIAQRIQDRDDRANPRLPGKLRKLILPSREAGRLLELLAAEKITRADLFPGYDGVVGSLFERGLWEVGK